MKKHYFAQGRGMSLSFLIIFTILFSATVHVFGQLLDPVSHPKFVTPLPIPARIDATNGGNFEMSMEQTVQNLGLFDPVTLAPLSTTVWGYGLLGQPVTYPGPTIEAKKNVPVNVTWHNNLPTTGHILPTDISLHMAHPHDPSDPSNPLTNISTADFYGMGYIPTVAHLHGGHTESGSDGLPEAWYTQEGMGMVYEGAFNVNGNAYHYDNDQEAATLWYHDHALGITRLNVYAGLAGYYLLTDDTEKQLWKNNVIPKNSQNIEIVIQDRMFYSTGELFLPAFTDDPWFGDAFGTGTSPEAEPLSLPFGPSVVAEFFGNFILVNGVAWPDFKVEPRKYRLRLLNGSDSRFYVLKFEDGTKFIQIGTDDGFLSTAVELDQLVIAPGERMDVVVDFADKFGNKIKLLNFGPDEPFKGFNSDGTLSDGEGGTLPPANTATTGQIMQFSVTKKLNNSKKFADASVVNTTPLRTPITPLSNPVETRKLVLFEGFDDVGRLQPLLGTMEDGSLSWFEGITENPALDAVEVWEVYNTTADAHPIHLHLVSFQIIDRQEISFSEPTPKDQPQHNGEIGTGGILNYDNITFGNIIPINDNEAGWKDTFIVPPGTVGRVIAKFDRPGRYVWHCHILSHEDHEMMRPYHVGPQQTALADMGIQPLTINQVYPNPFYSSTAVDFTLNSTSDVTMTVTDGNGNIVWTQSTKYDAGDHTFSFDATGLPTGTYYFQLTIDGFTDSQRIFKL